MAFKKFFKSAKKEVPAKSEILTELDDSSNRDIPQVQFSRHKIHLKFRDPKIILSFDMHKESSCYYFTLNDTRPSLQGSAMVAIAAKQLIEALTTAIGLPLMDTIITFIRYGEYAPRIASRQFHKSYLIKGNQFFPFGFEEVQTGWLLQMSDQNDWWVNK